MTNAYCDLATLKSAGALNINGSLYDRRLLALLEEASRRIDAYCNRHFYVLQATRRFEVNRWSAGLQQLLVPDLIGADTVRVADGFAGGEDPLEWRTPAHRLYPLDAAPERPWGRPYTRLALEPERDGRISDGPALVEIAGRWGYRQVVADTGVSIAAELDAGDSAMTVSDGGALSPGQTLAVGDEQLYVTAMEGNQATVERSVNGSGAAGHQAGSAIQVYRYPGPVVEACLRLAGEWWRNRSRPEAMAGGRQRVEAAGPGREAEELLSAYRKLTI